MLGGISFADDIHSVPNKFRLIVHFAAMTLMFYQWGILLPEYWWVVIIALIVCTGIINAYNFMDGINGITGGYSLAVLIPLLLLNMQEEYTDNNFIIVTLLSVLVFCLFNFRTRANALPVMWVVFPSHLFCLFSGLYILRSGNYWAIVLLMVYGVDSVLTICHRIMLHENIGQPHRKHAYQLMANELHIKHVTVSTIYMIVQLVISLGAIYLPVNKYLYLVVVLVLLCVAYILFKKKYYHLHEEYLRAKANERNDGN